MALKIALIVAVACIAQGYAHFFPRQYFKNQPELSLADNLQSDFQNTFNNLEGISSNVVSTASTQDASNSKDLVVIITCLAAQRERYVSLGKEINELFKQGSEELGKVLGEKYQEFREKVSEPLRKIGQLMEEFPQKMMELIQNRKFVEALNYVKESREQLEEKIKVLQETIKELPSELSEVAKTAQKWAQKIRSESEKGGLEIKESFRKCVEVGGPKTSEKSQ